MGLQEILKQHLCEAECFAKDRTPDKKVLETIDQLQERRSMNTGGLTSESEQIPDRTDKICLKEESLM